MAEYDAKSDSVVVKCPKCFSTNVEASIKISGPGKAASARLVTICYSCNKIRAREIDNYHMKLQINEFLEGYFDV